MNDFAEQLVAGEATKADQPALPGMLRQKHTTPDVAAAMSMVLGASVLVGWIFGQTQFNSVFRGLVAMQPITAVMFLASGVALLFANRPSRPVLPEAIIAIFVLLFGLLTLAQYITGVDLGTDRLLFGQSVMTQPVAMAHPGRMAEATAISFVLIAICLLLARTRNALMQRLYSASATLVVVFVIATLLGYLFRHGPLTSILGLSHVALNTALGLAALSVGLLVLRSDAGWVRLLTGDQVGASAARQLLPLVVIVPIAVAWLAYQGSEAGLYPQEVRLALITTVTLGLLVGLTIWAATRLNNLDAIRNTEQALHDTERRLEAVLNNASVAILTMDERQHCSYMNLAAEKMTGYTLAETAGRPLHDVIHHTRPDGTPYPLHECATNRVFKHNSPERGEETFVHRDGSFYPVAFSASPLVDDQSKPIGTILEVRNIEEEKALQDQVRHTHRLDAVGQLTGGIAHDFNNLLAIAIGNLDLLDENVSLDPDAHELLESARNACLGGAELTGRLLAFARKQMLQPVSTDINHLIAEYCKLLMRLLGAHIDLRHNLAKGLWQATADRGQLEAAITNLATNARDAMPQGGRLTISTRNDVLDNNYTRKHPGLAAGEYVAIEVTDSGSGMTPEVQAKAIEPFFTTKEEGKGTGLGLSMVFGFAKQSGGHVRIYSELGQGTTVTLLLPRADGAPADEAAWQGPTVPSAKSGETILVVDDNTALLRVAVTQLTALGYEVLQAGGGPSALELLKEKPQIDLLLTDIIMPGGLSGVDLGREARRVIPQLRIMYMSGFPESAFGDEARLDAGVILLRKPFRQAELAVRVREALDQ